MTRTFAPTPSPAATAPGPTRTRGLHPADDPADRPTALMTLTYAGQMTVGLLLASVGAHFLVRRSAAPGTRP
ncbi:hypothetical protein ACIGW1_33905 [Streptomyces sp. NPDC053780]|uniref:hypothetical protein n=1 Tax=unclassified Streptomyces TaxID=2593676 RepID=UPI0034495742